MELIKFVLKDFWTFIGFIIILNIFLYYTINGIVRIVFILKHK